MSRDEQYTDSSEAGQAGLQQRKWIPEAVVRGGGVKVSLTAAGGLAGGAGFWWQGQDSAVLAASPWDPHSRKLGGAERELEAGRNLRGGDAWGEHGQCFPGQGWGRTRAAEGAQAPGTEPQEVGL